MFNVFEFEKRQKQQKNLHKIEVRQKKSISRQRARNLEMEENYRSRVGNFIKKMIQEPQIVNDEMAKKLSKSQHQLWLQQNYYGQDFDSLHASSIEGPRTNILGTLESKLNPSATKALNNSFQQLDHSLQYQSKEQLTASGGALEARKHEDSLDQGMLLQTTSIDGENSFETGSIDGKVLMSDHMRTKNSTKPLSQNRDGVTAQPTGGETASQHSFFLPFAKKRDSGSKGGFLHTSHGGQMNYTASNFGPNRRSHKLVRALDASTRTNEGLRFKANKIQRVYDAVQANAILESSPSRLHEGTTFEKIMNLRPRQKNKELNGEFRFQPRSNVEKVVDAYNRRNPMHSTKDAEIYSDNMVKRNKHGVIIKKNFDLYHQIVKRDPRKTGSSDKQTFSTVRRSFNRRAFGDKKVSGQDNSTPLSTIDRKVSAGEISSKKSPGTKPNHKILLEPKKLFPKFHEKTHFKAVIEYSLGNQITARSLHDDHKQIEKQVMETSKTKNFDTSHISIKQNFQPLLVASDKNPASISQTYFMTKGLGQSNTSMPGIKHSLQSNCLLGPSTLNKRRGPLAIPVKATGKPIKTPGPIPYHHEKSRCQEINLKDEFQDFTQDDSTAEHIEVVKKLQTPTKSQVNEPEEGRIHSRNFLQKYQVFNETDGSHSLKQSETNYRDYRGNKKGKIPNIYMANQKTEETLPAEEAKLDSRRAEALASFNSHENIFNAAKPWNPQIIGPKPVTAATQDSTHAPQNPNDTSSDARAITQEVLRRCNIFRQKNLSVQPVRPGHGNVRLIHQTEENVTAFGHKKLSHNEIRKVQHQNNRSLGVSQFQNIQPSPVPFQYGNMAGVEARNKSSRMDMSQNTLNSLVKSQQISFRLGKNGSNPQLQESKTAFAPYAAQQQQ